MAATKTKTTKKVKPAPEKIEPVKEEAVKTEEKYYATVGRRKNAIARIRIYTKKASDEDGGEDNALITVNGKDYACCTKACHEVASKDVAGSAKMASEHEGRRVKSEEITGR